MMKFHSRETTKFTRHTKATKMFISHFRVFRVVRGSCVYKSQTHFLGFSFI
jgi:hypothetical protein